MDTPGALPSAELGSEHGTAAAALAIAGNPVPQAVQTAIRSFSSGCNFNGWLEDSFQQLQVMIAKITQLDKQASIAGNMHSERLRTES